MDVNNVPMLERRISLGDVCGIVEALFRQYIEEMLSIYNSLNKEEGILRWHAVLHIIPAREVGRSFWQ